MFKKSARAAVVDDSARLMSGARRLRFSGDLEARFRDDYFNNSLALCRWAVAAAFLLFMAFGLLDPYAMPSATREIWFIRYGIVSPLLLLALFVSFLPIFRRIMQPILSGVVLVTGFGCIAFTTFARPGELGYLFYPMGLLLTPMIGYSFLRLRFWWATVPSVIHMIVYAGCALWYQDILSVPSGGPIFINNSFFILATNFAGMATCYALELGARRGFISNYLLEQERAGERQQRERTEAMLQILSQAIGGIVHDLGNPLTAVQAGAQTLEMFAERSKTKVEGFSECLDIISNGAQMLDYLRLSLMEQTRVLDDKPVPLHRAPTKIRHIVGIGIRYQKPLFSSGHKITPDGDDIEVPLDEKKMITVLMNLIGNALKYSDGEVRIKWRVAGELLFVAVEDQGVKGVGISPEQAGQLFVAFGRLDTHEQIEGTGLGLLSVRKIAHAHGGEVFIETRGGDGSRWSTAQGTYPSMVGEGFRTAFVVVCPLNPAS